MFSEFVPFVYSIWTDSDDDDATDFEQRTKIRPVPGCQLTVGFYVELVAVVPVLRSLLTRHFHYANYYFPIHRFVPSLMRLYANDLAYLVSRAMIGAVDDAAVATLRIVVQVDPLDVPDFV